MADSVIEVVCNGKKGYFDVETYRANRSTAICIECEGKLYTPSDFEKFCGKEKAKKWRNSIKYQGQPIDKYLESIGIKSRKKNTAEEKGIPRKRANPSITSDSDGAKRRRNGTADEASASGLQNGSGESSEEDSMEEMEEQVRRVVSESSPSSLGRGVQDIQLGTIKKILLVNFMCHSRFEVEFSPYVNFIHGSNGSGKSAVLNGIIVGLGGRAKATDRASSVKGFIQHGCTFAEVTIWLCNEVSDRAHQDNAFKYDVYGDTIEICRKITLDGQSSYQIKNSKGRTVTTKREELGYIVDCFNIQVNNPVSVLSQDMSREYLHQQDPKKRYEIFSKATLFDLVEKNLGAIAELREKLQRLIEKKNAEIDRVAKPIKELEDQIKVASSYEEEERKLDKLRLELKWAYLNEMQAKLRTQEGAVEAETVKKSKLEQKVATCQEKIEELEENRQTVTASLESLRASVDELETQKLDVLRERRAKEKKHRDVIMKLKSQKRNKNEVEGSIDEFKRKIAEIRRRQRARDRIDSTQVRAELEGKLEAMRTKSEELRSKLDEVKREHKEAEDTADDTTKQLRETRYKVEEKEEALHHIERNMRTMESARQDRMRVFGPWVPQLLEEIRRNRSRFRQMPKGPLGSMMSVLEQKWAPVVERCFKREFFPAFLCDNHADSELLKSIMRRVIDRRNRIPDVYTTPFRGSVYRYKDTMPSSSYPTMLSVIDVHDPDVLNLILDMHQPHKVLLIEDPRVAREYIFFNCPPKASKAYALDACEIFPSGNFYHGYSNLRAFYFQPNREDNVRSMKEEATQLNQDLKTIKESRDDLERVSLQQRERLKYLKSTIRDFIQQQRDLSAKEKDCEQRLATLAEDDEQETEEEIASCETEIAHLNEELEEIGRQMEETQEEMEEMENEIDRIGVDLDNLSSEHARLKEKINHDREKWDTFDEKVRRLTARKGELEGKAQTVEQNLTKLQKGVSEQRRLCEETREKVLRLDHGREITTSRSSRELETEIKSIEDLLEQERGDLPDLHELNKKYSEMLKWRKELMHKLDISNDFYKILRTTSIRRNSLLPYLKDMIAHRVAKTFKSELEMRGYTGKLNIDIDERTIEMIVRISRSTQGETNTRSLSGGERSYTTICFLLALWKVAQVPFRILDEFDVFMDVMSRDVAIRRLLVGATSENSRQYLLLTPLSTVSDLRVRNPELLKVLHLQPPERTEEGMAVNE